MPPKMTGQHPGIIVVTATRRRAHEYADLIAFVEISDHICLRDVMRPKNSTGSRNS